MGGLKSSQRAEMGIGDCHGGGGGAARVGEGSPELLQLIERPEQSDHREKSKMYRIGPFLANKLLGSSHLPPPLLSSTVSLHPPPPHPTKHTDTRSMLNDALTLTTSLYLGLSTTETR